MKIYEVTDKKEYLPLLLIGDEQESMIDRYIQVLPRRNFLPRRKPNRKAFCLCLSCGTARASNFNVNSLDDFIRRQKVSQCWRRDGEDYALKPVSYTEDCNLTPTFHAPNAP